MKSDTEEHNLLKRCVSGACVCLSHAEFHSYCELLLTWRGLNFGLPNFIVACLNRDLKFCSKIEVNLRLRYTMFKGLQINLT